MYIINEKDWGFVSAIIGVCGVNFCTFISDSRKITYINEEMVTTSEDFQKVFKVNQNVVFGATGLFNNAEDLLAPLEKFKSKDEISLQGAVNATIAYSEKRIHDAPIARNYLIGGKDEDGKFCIYEIHSNFEIGKVEVNCRKPQPPQSAYGISLSVPSSVNKQGCVNAVSEAIRQSKTHDEMIHNTADVIGAIAEFDKSVNRNIIAVSVM